MALDSSGADTRALPVYVPDSIEDWMFASALEGTALVISLGVNVEHAVCGQHRANLNRGRERAMNRTATRDLEKSALLVFGQIARQQNFHFDAVDRPDLS